MQAVRFHQNTTWTHCKGLIHCEAGQIRLEYQVEDGILGVVKSGVKQVSIPLDRLASIELVERCFQGPKLVLQAREMTAVENAPGMNQGRIELSIARGDRHAARELIDLMQKPVMPDGWEDEI